jgi:hypothetical protein
MMNSSKTKQGLCQKYKVTRVDGSSNPGGKHADCSYFVLDLEHRPLRLAGPKGLC